MKVEENSITVNSIDTFGRLLKREYQIEKSLSVSMGEVVVVEVDLSNLQRPLDQGTSKQSETTGKTQITQTERKKEVSRVLRVIQHDSYCYSLVVQKSRSGGPKDNNANQIFQSLELRKCKYLTKNTPLFDNLDYVHFSSNKIWTISRGKVCELDPEKKEQNKLMDPSKQLFGFYEVKIQGEPCTVMLGPSFLSIEMPLKQKKKEFIFSGSDVLDVEMLDIVSATNRGNYSDNFGILTRGGIFIEFRISFERLRDVTYDELGNEIQDITIFGDLYLARDEKWQLWIYRRNTLRSMEKCEKVDTACLIGKPFKVDVLDEKIGRIRVVSQENPTSLHVIGEGKIIFKPAPVPLVSSNGKDTQASTIEVKNEGWKYARVTYSLGSAHSGFTLMNKKVLTSKIRYTQYYSYIDATKRYTIISFKYITADGTFEDDPITINNEELQSIESVRIESTSSMLVAFQSTHSKLKIIKLETRNVKYKEISFDPKEFEIHNVSKLYDDFMLLMCSDGCLRFIEIDGYDIIRCLRIEVNSLYRDVLMLSSVGIKGYCYRNGLEFNLFIMHKWRRNILTRLYSDESNENIVKQETIEIGEILKNSLQSLSNLEAEAQAGMRLERVHRRTAVLVSTSTIQTYECKTKKSTSYTNNNKRILSCASTVVGGSVHLVCSFENLRIVMMYIDEERDNAINVYRSIALEESSPILRRLEVDQVAIYREATHLLMVDENDKGTVVRINSYTGCAVTENPSCAHSQTSIFLMGDFCCLHFI